MENASKALLMAGGILIAILIIGAVTFLFRDVTETQRVQEESIQVQQLNEYNKQFSGYERILYGHELLSLINKIINTNRRIYNAKDGYDYISINVVNSGTYNLNSTPLSESDVGDDSNTYKELIAARNKPGEYGISEEDFKSIVQLKERIANNSAEDARKAQLQLDSLMETLHMTRDITSADIELYNKYITFKEKKFKYINTGYSDNGRINSMTFQVQ